MVRSTVRLVSPSCFVYRTPQRGLTDDPGLPFRWAILIVDLGQRLEAPSYVFCLTFAPFSSVLSLQSRKLSLDLSLLSCVLLCAAPLPTTRKPCPPSILFPSAFAKTLRRTPSPPGRSRSPRLSDTRQHL